MGVRRMGGNESLTFENPLRLWVLECYAAARERERKCGNLQGKDEANKQ